MIPFEPFPLPKNLSTKVSSLLTFFLRCLLQCQFSLKTFSTILLKYTITLVPHSHLLPYLPHFLPTQNGYCYLKYHALVTNILYHLSHFPHKMCIPRRASIFLFPPQVIFPRVQENAIYIVGTQSCFLHNNKYILHVLNLRYFFLFFLGSILVNFLL